MSYTLDTAAAAAASAAAVATATQVRLPRVTITYCTQCRWMLRAAYFGQELLSTFGTAIGEVALVPASGGTFIVALTYHASDADANADTPALSAVLWDRKAEGGFPETKVLKQRVRDRLDPTRHLGHSDVHGVGSKHVERQQEEEEEEEEEKREDDAMTEKRACTDC